MDEIRIEKSIDGFEIYHYKNGALVDQFCVEKISIEIEIEK